MFKLFNTNVQAIRFSYPCFTKGVYYIFINGCAAVFKLLKRGPRMGMMHSVSLLSSFCQCPGIGFSSIVRWLEELPTPYTSLWEGTFCTLAIHISEVSASEGPSFVATGTGSSTWLPAAGSSRWQHRGQLRLDRPWSCSRCALTLSPHPQALMSNLKPD